MFLDSYFLEKNFKNFFSNNIFQKNCEIQIHKLNFAQKFFEKNLPKK